jgi:hypothetical protein
MRTTSARRAGAALAAAVALTGCAETGEPANTSFTAAEELRATEPVRQTFVATNDGLTLVRVWIGTYGVPGPSGTLTATISDASGPVREVGLGGAGLRDLQAQSIVFEPIPDSAGRTFEVALAWDGVNRAAVLTNEFDAYPDGEASTGGDLRFEIGTADRIGAAGNVVASTATHVADRVADDPVFWLVWLSGLVALGVVAMRRRRQPADEPSREPTEP